MAQDKINCPKGTIRRKSYVTRKGVKVASTCIKDRGGKGKGPKTLPKLDNKHSLRRMGYSLLNKKDNRQKALNKAIKVYDKLDKTMDRRDTARMVLRRLVLIRNYNKANKNAHKKLTNDITYIRHKYMQ